MCVCACIKIDDLWGERKSVVEVQARTEEQKQKRKKYCIENFLTCMILPFNIKVIYLYPYILKMYRHMHTFCRAIQVFYQVKKKANSREKSTKCLYCDSTLGRCKQISYLCIYIYICVSL